MEEPQFYADKYNQYIILKTGENGRYFAGIVVYSEYEHMKEGFTAYNFDYKYVLNYRDPQRFKAYINHYEEIKRLVNGNKVDDKQDWVIEKTKWDNHYI